jgi:hypothetical protein
MDYHIIIGTTNNPEGYIPQNLGKARTKKEEWELLVVHRKWRQNTKKSEAAGDTHEPERFTLKMPTIVGLDYQLIFCRQHISGYSE